MSKSTAAVRHRDRARNTGRQPGDRVELSRSEIQNLLLTPALLGQKEILSVQESQLFI